MSEKKKKMGGSEVLFQGAVLLAFSVFTFMCVYPFYYLIINSISANDLSAAGEVMFYPKNIHFNNYKDALTIPGLGQSAFISVMRTLLGTAVTIVGTSFLAFMFTQEKMWGRKFWYRFTILTMYINAGIIPWYLTMKTLGLTNNFLAYILPAIVQPFNLILVKTYIESTPRDLQEAAQIDGAGILKIFVKIILPISKPILATVAIFAAVGQWNSFFDTLMLMTDTKLYPLQMILYQYINQASSLAQSIISNNGSASAIAQAATAQTATSVRMTVSVIVVLPIMCVYPFMQKYFVKGIMIGSVKG